MLERSNLQVRKFHPENERTKHRYLGFLSDAKRLSAGTIEQVAAALADFEKSTGHRDFRLFRPEQAQSYKRRLNDATNPKTGKPLAKATVASRLASLKTFFQWLAVQPGCKSRLNYSDAEYFNQSANDVRIAKAVREKHVPSLEQVRHVLKVMPSGSDIERRDRALLAFAILSGARDSAIASLSLRHVDLGRRRVLQDPSQGVRTKFSKTINSKFFPVGWDIEAIFVEWVRFLQTERLWGPNDPLFPPSKSERTQNGVFEHVGFARTHWKSAATIRIVFRKAFQRAGLPYANPHVFRDTLTILGEKSCTTAEEFKTWSLNLGHDSVLTTFTSYGNVPQHRQDEILERMANRPLQSDDPVHSPDLVIERLERIVAELKTQRP
jgi:integrase/recombinase XerC